MCGIGVGCCLAVASMPVVDIDRHFHACVHSILMEMMRVADLIAINFIYSAIVLFSTYSLI